MWRDDSLRAAWRRFHEVFAQVVPYTSDEHEWAFLNGRSTAGPDPVGEMLTRLPRLAIRPTSIDADSLRSRAVPSFRLRNHAPVDHDGARSPRI
jgi:spermidine synthase